MKFDLGKYDLEGYDQTIITSAAGLLLLKCAAWTEGSGHGGAISANEVISLFDDITESENVAGMVDYRKAFISSTYADVLSKTYWPVLVDPPVGLGSRITLQIALGTDADTYATKPADETFSDTVMCDVYAETHQAIWIKREITSISPMPAYTKDVIISIMVSGE